MVKIGDKRIYLRTLIVQDNLIDYLRWMNDEEVLRFTESKGKVYREKDLKDYIVAMSTEENRFLGIFLNENNQHIGNIKLGNIHPVHKRADLGIIIGEKSFWGQEIATEAIEILTHYAFITIHLKKIFAGVYANNIGSYKAFLKAGFKECGRMKDHEFFEGKFVDCILVEKINEEYNNG